MNISKKMQDAFNAQITAEGRFCFPTAVAASFVQPNLKFGCSEYKHFQCDCPHGVTKIGRDRFCRITHPHTHCWRISNSPERRRRASAV